ncbi:MAG: glycoside hydrolase family 15 protein [Vicinamibacteria bacterium]
MPRLLASAQAAATLCLCLALARPAPAGPAPGAPGDKPTWTNGNKQGIGTSAGLESRIWFSLGGGALTEVCAPTIDRPQLRLLELVLLGPDGALLRETRDMRSEAALADPKALAFLQTSTGGGFRVEKTTFADPARDAVLVRVRVSPPAGRWRAFVHVDPALAATGVADEARLDDALLTAWEGGEALALGSAPAFARGVVGYAGASDGLGELAANRPLPAWSSAGPGNVAALLELPAPSAGSAEWTLALGFGSSPAQARGTVAAALAIPWGETLEAYRRGWHEWLRPLRRPALVREQYDASLMVLRALEDKTHRGGMIASFSTPWGDRAEATTPEVGGYRLVWSRDLYHASLALHLAGDTAAARRALDHLLRVQQRPDGSFPQNAWLDGRPYWPSTQLDEVAYPILLAQEIGATEAATWERLRRSADYLVAQGPATPQERWEEEGGYSPSSLAAQIAGLVVAGDLASRNRDPERALRYRDTADAWAARLDQWTVTRTGPHSSLPYFLRIAQRGRPDAGDTIELNNGAGSFDERAIVDAGFLDLVRLGVRRPDDPVVAASVAVVDRLLRVETPQGPAFYRYNHDGYGEKADGSGWNGTGIGRLWPLLGGERGEYELAAGRDARPWLESLARFAGEGRMLPEQVWDRLTSPRGHLRFGAGTGAATPLAWTHAQLVRLALGVDAGRVLGVSPLVRERFAKREAATR